jgi:class 3 adenylate cyclase/tetratricopeptide (TPR) repeat protein
VLRCASCNAALADPSTSTEENSRLLLESQREAETARRALGRLRRYIPSVVVEGVLHDQARLRGERREVAVLFADAVDFTHLSASLDAESIFRLINDVLGRLVMCVHRYGGMVDKFLGDGLMGVFGAPIAHESDPELAVRAALDMQRAVAEFEPIARAQLGAPLKIRIGIHSGPVIAGIVGTEEQATYTVIGETVNLAARLESLARPGSILTSSRIHQQTQALFNFHSLGKRHVKGVDEQVEIFEVVGTLSEPLQTRGVTGVTSIFLGRDAELQRFTATLASFLDDRRGRLVMVHGEAGMGKSRLVSEGLAATATDGVAVWRGHGLPYSQGTGYSVFRSLFQDALHNRPAGSAAWDAHVSSELRPFLHQLMGYELTQDRQAALRNLEPERVKQLTSLAVREWFMEEARRQPVLLILEDFHWADDLSRDLLQTLVHSLLDLPIIFCVVSRPTPGSPLELAVPAHRAAEEGATLELNLAPLSPEHSRALLGHLVDLEDMPAMVVETILERAEGNPFYIEEFVRTLIEKDVLRLGERQWKLVSDVALQSLEVPTTLRGLMMARVDRLPQELQHVLRNAAVIGLQFPARLLGEVERRVRGDPSVHHALERLTELGLLVERPEAGERVYAFRHILTQETIYDSMLHSRRPEMHRVVAECIEDLYSDELRRYIEVLALHYDRARVRDKALHYALLAGDRARERFANREAIEHYSRALQLSQHLGGYETVRWRAVVGLGDVERHIGEYEEASACYQAALEDWPDAGPMAQSQVMLKIAQVWDKRGDLDVAQEWLRRGLTVIDEEDLQFPALRAEIFSELGWLALRRGDLATAQEYLEEGLQLVEEIGRPDVLSSILNRLGAVYYHRGEMDRSAEYVERSLELREQLGDIVGVARSCNNLGIVKKLSGDWEGALAEYERAVALHERMGEVEGLALASTNLGVLYTERGDWARAEESLKRSLVIAREIDHPYELAQVHMNLGRLYLMQGRGEECARHLNLAIPLYKEAGARAHLNLNDAYDLQGQLHLLRGEIKAAQEWARRSYELLQDVTSDSKESAEWGRHEQLMGRIAQTQGELQKARRHFERSAEIFEARGVGIELGRTTYWNALLLLELGEVQQARGELLHARELFSRIGAAADLKRVAQQLSALE